MYTRNSTKLPSNYLSREGWRTAGKLFLCERRSHGKLTVEVNPSDPKVCKTPAPSQKRANIGK